MQTLLAVIEQFLADPVPDGPWRELLSPRGPLHGHLRRAVASEFGAADQNALFACRRRLHTHDFLPQLAALPGGQTSEDEVDNERLRRNLAGLLACAQAASCLTNESATEQRGTLLAEAVGEAVGILGTKGEDTFSSVEVLGAARGDTPTARADALFAWLAKRGWEITGARLWTRWWLDANSLEQPRLRIPFAAHDERRQTGTLAHLHILPLGGRGPLLEHPEIALRRFGKRWLESLRQAWAPTGFAGWWNRVPVDPAESSLLPLLGDSAGGAAAVGFVLASQERLYDRDCIVMCRVDRGRLCGVGAEREKIEAARQGGCRRVIVACAAPGSAGTGLSDQDIHFLHEQGVRVERLPTLDDAVGLVSALTTEVRDYLQQLIDLPDSDPPPYLGDRRLTQGLYEELDVLRQADGPGFTSPASPRAARRSLVKKSAGSSARASSVGQRVPWSGTVRTIRQGVLLGGPGEGKTSLVCMTVRQLATTALAELQNQRQGASDLVLPISLRLPQVAEAGSLPAAIGRAQQQSSLGLVKHLTDLVWTERCWLFLDGLDEVSGIAAENRLRHALAPLRNARCRVVVTSRLHGYDRSKLPFPTVQEYELAPLTPRQKQGFVARWFAGDPERRAQVQALIEASPQLAGDTCNALLLTLTCATCERHHVNPQPMRRVDLYNLLIPDLLRGAWRQSARSETDPRLATLRRLLRRVVADLFTANPAQSTFSADEVLDALERHSKGSLEYVAGVLEELRDQGLLLCPKSGQYMFLQRSVLEYLAAEELARQPDPASALAPFLPRRVGGHYHWQPAAAEMMCLLAGCMPDPNPLLRRLIEMDAQQPDLSRTLLLLAGRALAEVDPDSVEPELAQRIVAAVYALWTEDRDWLPSEQLLPALANRWGIPLLQQGLDNPDATARLAAVRALGKLGSVHVAPRILTALADPDDDVRWSAARALRWLGGDEAVEPLSLRLEDRSQLVQTAVAEALICIGSTRAIEVLTQAIHTKTARIREMIVSALGHFGSGDWVVGLLLAAMNDREPRVRLAGGLALCALGVERAGDYLLRALQTIEGPVRQAAARALASLGREWRPDLIRGEEPPALPRDPNGNAWPLEAIRHPDPVIRMAATCVLGTLRGEQATRQLTDALLNDADPGVRFYAGEALADMGQGVARATFAEAMHHPDAKTRRDVVEALGWLNGCDWVVELLPAALNDADSAVRRSAVVALGGCPPEQARPLLSRALADSAPEVRSTAVNALVRLAGATAVAQLRIALDDPSALVRQTVVNALARAGSEGSEGLSAALGHDDPEVRRTAALALGRSGSEGAFERLRDALNDPVPQVRYAAVHALGEIGGERVAAWLVQALPGLPEGSRRLAYGVLARLSHRTGLLIPIAALGDRPRTNENLITS